MTGTPARSPFRTAEERDAERAAKREAVLQAAVDMFNDRGFSGTSLDDVAASLGVTKPVIYHYLGTKDQVLLECLGRGLAALEAAAAESAGRPGTGADRLRAFLIRYAEVNMSPFGRSVVLTADHELSPDGLQRFRAMKRRIDAALRALVAAGIADGSLAPVDVRTAAFTLAGALNWIPRWQHPDGAQPPSKVAEEVVAMLMHGLVGARNVVSPS
ncbi:MAG: TetR/AcrR family transcriptional regulator [Sphingomonadales bacterium]|nr:MAG: TetR/AcrR family transcriptional regulator [Sphingomonadales bacterium]